MISLVDLTAQYHSIKEEIDSAVLSTLESGHFILGPQVVKFEESIAAYLGVNHAIGLASGTDALVLALRALNIGAGDEVIIPAYTFFATAGTVMSVGAKPVFVDVDPQSYQIDVSKIKSAITSKTKAIIPVHLYGHPAEMNPILEIARENNLKVIEDNAQGLGAEYLGRKTGSFGDISCLSFFPTKNLGAFGDAGMVVTNDPSLVERMRMLRTHGWKKKYYSEEVGYNSRLDALQAAILQAKFPHFLAPSHTKGRTVELIVSPEYLARGERVLNIDDFLATSQTILGLARLTQVAGGTLVGIGTLIEKSFEGGRALLEPLGPPIEALAIIANMDAGQIIFAA